MKNRTRIRLSVVIPFLNEQASLPVLRDRFQRLDGLPEERELIFVSDGSTDDSAAIVEAWAAEDPRVKLAVLTRNFGHQAAISAGLDLAAGEHVGIMDADLQDPPEVLAEMYAEAREGDWDIVYSVRSRRRGPATKRMAYGLFYILYSLAAESPIDHRGGDFCVLSRKAADALISLPEKVRFVRGLRSWLGLRTKAVSTDRPERAAGSAQYSWTKLLVLALDGLTSFSTRPLRMATVAGLTLCCSSLLLALGYLGLWVLYDIHSKVPGFTTIVLLILFLSGVQLFMMGIIGEYIGQIFLEVKRRPTYLLARTVNIHPDPDG